MRTISFELFADADRKSRVKDALSDILGGARNYHLWMVLAWSEIKQRYRRSVIGPFWLTLSTAIMIGAMGPLYGRLFGQPLGDYFSYLAVNIIIWQLISTTVNGACTVFTSSESFILQTRFPFSMAA